MLDLKIVDLKLPTLQLSTLKLSTQGISAKIMSLREGKRRRKDWVCVRKRKKAQNSIVLKNDFLFEKVFML
jgi:hypothetical protein